MTDLATPTLPIDKIVVEDGFNPRRTIDPDELERFAASLDRIDFVQPIAVRPGEDGKYVVVAGARRLAAAKLAGRKSVPITLSRHKSPRSAALAENLHRVDLNPIDLALGMKEMAEELGLRTNKEIAEELGFSAPWVGEHLRLLRLPEGVQEYIAAGNVPVDAERALRKIAAVSPRVAECICELAQREGVKPAHFVSRLGELFEATAGKRFDDPPTMIGTVRSRVSEVVLDPDKARELGDRLLAARPYEHTSDPAVRFSQEELDAARAAGCLVEHEVSHGEWKSVIAFITDAEFAADLAERHVEEAERRATEAKRERERQFAAEAGAGAAASEEAKDGPTPHEQRKAEQAAARRWNQEVGRRLLAHRETKVPKERQLARTKALVLAFIRDNQRFAGRGLRLTLTQLQSVEHKQLKTTGETREKVSYATPEEADQWLRDRVMKARSIPELIDVWTEAVLASVLVDERELPQSKRVGGGETLHAIGAGGELLEPDLKAVKPSRKRSHR